VEEVFDSSRQVLIAFYLISINFAMVFLFSFCLVREYITIQYNTIRIAVHSTHLTTQRTRRD
jgi:hypothetical protein